MQKGKATKRDRNCKYISKYNVEQNIVREIYLVKTRISSTIYKVIAFGNLRCTITGSRKLANPSTPFNLFEIT